MPPSTLHRPRPHATEIVRRPAATRARRARPSRTAGRPASMIGVVLVALVWSSATVRADLIINEVKSKGSPQKVELKNTGPGSVTLDDFAIKSSRETKDPVGTGSLPPDSFHTLTLQIRRRGDCIELFDSSLRSALDRVDFGDSGGAPHDIESVSLSSIARVDETPDPTGTLSAHLWSIDFDETFNAENDARPPQLGAAIEINEIVPGPMDDVLVELFNPMPFSIDLSGWLLTSGQSIAPLFDSIGPGDVRPFNVPQLGFEFSFNSYLVAPDSVRLDQLGLSDAPGDSSTYFWALSMGASFQRIPDGEGPNDGWDLPSSGFPESLQICMPTPGIPNFCIPPAAAGETAQPPLAGRLRAAPNPFNPSTWIHFTLERAAPVRLSIYDSSGHLVRTLLDARRAAGSHRTSWDGRDARGEVRSGVYFLQLESGSAARTVKVVLAR